MPDSPPLPVTTVFVKRPDPGAVKTRLTPPLTPEAAAQLARAMLDDLVERLSVEDSFRTELAVAPGDARDEFLERYSSVDDVGVQEGESLGERLAAWFDARCPHAPSVVVVGGDCPLLAASLVRRAHELLEAGAEAVFAPDSGGGYALVGLRRPAPELFLDVAMSTPSNLHETLDRAAALGLLVELLPEQRDVDRAVDLAAVARELNTRLEAGELSGFPRRTHETLHSLLVGAPM